MRKSRNTRKRDYNKGEEKKLPQQSGYLIKEPSELMTFLAKIMPDASRTKLKLLLAKRVVMVDNVITTQYNFLLQPGMKVEI
ncbi:MAG: RNA pseudouridine synthase, partial [Bacteroidaceae bacterium]